MAAWQSKTHYSPYLSDFRDGLGPAVNWEKKADRMEYPAYFADWLINLNGMSTCLELFYALTLGNCIHCTFIFTFFELLFLKSFFAHGPIEYELFLNRSIWLIDGNQKGTTTSDQSGPEGNGNEVVLNTPQILAYLYYKQY